MMTSRSSFLARLPRTRGGVPGLPAPVYQPLIVFPARAGVFPCEIGEYVRLTVFPARAGVFPAR